LDFAQLAATRLGWLDCADDLLPAVGAVDYDRDRLHALGGPAGSGAAAADKLAQLRVELSVYALHEPRKDIAASCETQPLIAGDRDVHAGACDLAIAIGATPHAAPGEALLLDVLSDGHAEELPGPGTEA
jgi:hypothetical protein